ncbi:MAG: hypothetical protein IPL59_14310 [Candidatus Competibacteraceae bacterium]|nr:hypothetical protein [Candidatus Competibacteraceae bacterium]
MVPPIRAGVKPLGDNVTALQAELPLHQLLPQELFASQLHGDADAALGFPTSASNGWRKRDQGFIS